MADKVTKPGENQVQDYAIKFSEPFMFEEKQYEGLDLNKLHNMTSEQFFEVSRQFSTDEYISPRPEADPKFCCMLAASVCGVPHNFFDKLPVLEVIKVRNGVQSFFQSKG